MDQIGFKKNSFDQNQQNFDLLFLKIWKDV